MKYSLEAMQNTFAPMKKKNNFNSFENEQYTHRKEHKSFRDVRQVARKNKRLWDAE